MLTTYCLYRWWNPAAEWQSADRCHRIGQTRPCIITRLCIEDSVESRMVLLQEKKTNMINSTVNADDASMEALTRRISNSYSEVNPLYYFMDLLLDIQLVQ